MRKLRGCERTLKQPRSVPKVVLFIAADAAKGDLTEARKIETTYKDSIAALEKV